MWEFWSVKVRGLHIVVVTECGTCKIWDLQSLEVIESGSKGVQKLPCSCILHSAGVTCCNVREFVSVGIGD